MRDEIYLKAHLAAVTNSSRAQITAATRQIGIQFDTNFGDKKFSLQEGRFYRSPRPVCLSDHRFHRTLRIPFAWGKSLWEVQWKLEKSLWRKFLAAAVGWTGTSRKSKASWESMCSIGIAETSLFGIFVSSRVHSWETT